MQSFWGITVSVEASEKLVASCRLHSETVMHQGGRLDTRDEPKSEAMLGNTDQHMGDAVGQNGRMGEGSEGDEDDEEGFAKKVGQRDPDDSWTMPSRVRRLAFICH